MPRRFSPLITTHVAIRSLPQHGQTVAMRAGYELFPRRKKTSSYAKNVIILSPHIEWAARTAGRDSATRWNCLRDYCASYISGFMQLVVVNTRLWSSYWLFGDICFPVRNRCSRFICDALRLRYTVAVYGSVSINTVVKACVNLFPSLDEFLCKI